MDDIHTRLNGSIVAHSRFIAVHADAICSDTLGRLLAGIMQIGLFTRVAFATNLHANLAARLPHPVPCFANSPRSGAIGSRLVAHSRLLFNRFQCFNHKRNR